MALKRAHSNILGFPQSAHTLMSQCKQALLSSPRSKHMLNHFPPFPVIVLFWFLYNKFPNTLMQYIYEQKYKEYFPKQIPFYFDNYFDK